MMKSNRRQLLRPLIAAAVLPLAAVFAPCSVAADKHNTDFTSVFSSKDTDAVFVVDNFFKYGHFDEKSPMAKLLANPAVQTWVEDFFPSQITDLKDELDLSPKEIARLFSGKGAVALMLKQPDTAKPTMSIETSSSGEKTEKKADGQEETETRMSTSVVVDPEDALPRYDEVMLIEFKGSPAEYEELANKLEAETKRKAPATDIKRERIEGVTLRTIDIPKDDKHETAFSQTAYLALYEGTILASTNRSVLLDTMHNLARGTATEPLSGRSDYLADKKEMGANDGFFFANLGTATPKMREFLVNALKAQTEANPMIKAMVDPKTLMDAIALENFTSLYGAVNVSEQDVEARYGLTWKDPAGLASLIRFGSSPVTIPDFASGDYKGIDVTTADYRSMWEAADHLVQTALPTFYPMIGMAVASHAEVAGFLAKARQGTLDNLDGGVVSLTGFSSANPPINEVPSKAVVIKVKDPAAAQTGIDAMVGLLGSMAGGGDAPKFEPINYLGVKIYKLPRPMMFQTKTVYVEPNADGSIPATPPDTNEAVPQVDYFFYAVVENHLVVCTGTEEFTKGVIANVQKPSRAGVAGKFKDALGDVPGTPCSLSYGDVATYLMAADNVALSSNIYQKQSEERDDLVKAREAAKDLHYFWAGKCYASPSGFFGRLTISEDRDYAH